MFRGILYLDSNFFFECSFLLMASFQSSIFAGVEINALSTVGSSVIVMAIWIRLDSC